jgi:DNA modification methylase
MEEANHKTKVQGQRRFSRLRLPATKRLCHLRLRIHTTFQKRKTWQFASHDQRRYERAFTKKQRDEWFTQIWAIIGTRQKTSQIERRIAAFPDEIADRLIRMFSVKGDTVLDPSLGSGTTTKIAMRTERNSVGYEADETLIPLIKKKIGLKPRACKLSFIKREN